MDGLKKKLESIHAQTGKKVSIITHSMGGLVVKSFLALNEIFFKEHVSSWIAIAAPFRGLWSYSRALWFDKLQSHHHFFFMSC